MLLCAVLAAWGAWSSPAWAQPPAPWRAGVRAGVSDGRNEEDFRQAEIFAGRRLARAGGPGAPLAAEAALEAAAGVLHGGGETGFVGGLGPVLRLVLLGGRITLSAGIAPTVSPRDTYGREDLGGALQFTSHAGLSIALSERLWLGYRLQHMSNAGLYRHNPGVNLHLLEAGWRF